MSRIGRMPIAIPKGVEVKIDGSRVQVKGPKGQLERTFVQSIQLAIQDDTVVVSRTSEDREQRALHGMTRAILNNMVTGVHTGFERILEVNGVGYRAEMQGANLVLNVGFSHPVVVKPPAGIKFDVDAKTRQIKVMGFDKELVGQVTANIRKVRPPEPYQGKGIKYLEENIRRKAGKSGKV